MNKHKNSISLPGNNWRMKVEVGRGGLGCNGTQHCIVRHGGRGEESYTKHLQTREEE